MFTLFTIVRLLGTLDGLIWLIWFVTFCWLNEFHIEIQKLFHSSFRWCCILFNRQIVFYTGAYKHYPGWMAEIKNHIIRDCFTYYNYLFYFLQYIISILLVKSGDLVVNASLDCNASFVKQIKWILMSFIYQREFVVHFSARHTNNKQLLKKSFEK